MVFGEGFCRFLVFGRITAGEDEESGLCWGDVLVEEGTESAGRDTCRQDDFVGYLSRQALNDYFCCRLRVV